MKNEERTPACTKAKQMIIYLACCMVMGSILISGVGYSKSKEIDFAYGSSSEQVRTFAPTVGEFLDAQNITLLQDDYVEPKMDQPIEQNMTVKVTTVRTKAVTETTEIPYDKVEKESAQLFAGSTKVTQEGENGSREDIYVVSVVNDEETDRDLLCSNVVKEPVDEVVEHGTTNLHKEGFAYKSVMEVNATAYYEGFNMRNGVPARTASGMPLRYGIIAVDPKVIPLGTQVYIEDPNGVWNYGYAVAGDTGGAIKGNRVDLCLHTYNDAIQFGRRTLKLYVLE